MSRCCEEFNCLPSDLENEDILQLIEIMDMRAYALAKRLVEQADVDESALERSGIPNEMISQVMANIGRLANDKR